MATILDSTGPYTIPQKKVMVNIKLIDKSTADTKITSVKMFAWSKKELPSISAIGNVIFLKNAQVETFNEIKMLRFNVSS